MCGMTLIRCWLLQSRLHVIPGSAFSAPHADVHLPPGGPPTEFLVEFFIESDRHVVHLRESSCRTSLQAQHERVYYLQSSADSSASAARQRPCLCALASIVHACETVLWCSSPGCSTLLSQLMHTMRRQCTVYRSPAWLACSVELTWSQPAPANGAVQHAEAESGASSSPEATQDAIPAPSGACPHS